MKMRQEVVTRHCWALQVVGLGVRMEDRYGGGVINAKMLSFKFNLFSQFLTLHCILS